MTAQTLNAEQDSHRNSDAYDQNLQWVAFLPLGSSVKVHVSLATWASYQRDHEARALRKPTLRGAKFENAGDMRGTNDQQVKVPRKNLKHTGDMR